MRKKVEGGGAGCGGASRPSLGDSFWLMVVKKKENFLWVMGTLNLNMVVD